MLYLILGYLLWVILDITYITRTLLSWDYYEDNPALSRSPSKKILVLMILGGPIVWGFVWYIYKNTHIE